MITGPVLSPFSFSGVRITRGFGTEELVLSLRPTFWTTVLLVLLLILALAACSRWTRSVFLPDCDKPCSLHNPFSCGSVLFSCIIATTSSNSNASAFSTLPLLLTFLFGLFLTVRDSDIGERFRVCVGWMLFGWVSV